MRRNVFYLTCLLSFFSSAQAKQSFDTWKKNYAKKAARRGIPKDFTRKIFKSISYDQTVVDRDRNQVLSSKKVDYATFMKRWLREDNARIEKGKRLLKENHDLLVRIEKKYQVDKEVIVSLWGVETFYGQINGNYNVVNSLATLVYDGRRRRFYENQLNAALRLIYKGHISLDEFKGSWAGATGQCQFMPSNIKLYGQDFNQDGRIDIWKTKEDIFASIAYFLQKVGWKKGKSIGSMAINTDKKKIDLNHYRTKRQYNRLGFRTLAGKKISDDTWKRRRAMRILMKDAPIILRGTNFAPLLKWNKSGLFAAFNIILLNSFGN